MSAQIGWRTVSSPVESAAKPPTVTTPHKWTFVKGREGMAQWWGRSPLTIVARVWFPYPASYVCWVCCWFSSLLREVFLQIHRFSPLLKNQHFQIPIQSWNAQTFLNEFLRTPKCSMGKQITFTFAFFTFTIFQRAISSHITLCKEVQITTCTTLPLLWASFVEYSFPFFFFEECFFCLQLFNTVRFLKQILP